MGSDFFLPKRIIRDWRRFGQFKVCEGRGVRSEGIGRREMKRGLAPRHRGLLGTPITISVVVAVLFFIGQG